MRLPRVRFTVRGMMIAVAAVAVLLLAAIAFAGRPHPTSTWQTNLGYVVDWSDGTSTDIEPTARPLSLSRWRWVTLVHWPDGSNSLYLHLR